MSDDATFTAIAAILSLLLIGFIFMLAVFHDKEIIEPDYEKICEEKGGVYLDRTYQSGKYTNHSYTCVRKDSIIEMEEK